MKHYAQRLPRVFGLPLLLIGFATAGCDLADSNDDDHVDRTDVIATRSFDESVDVTSQTKFYLQNVNGDIEIEHSTHTGTVRIEAELVAGSDSRRDAEEWLDKLDIEIERGSTTIAVDSRYPLDNHGRRLEIKYRVHVPEGMNLQVRHVNGEITLSGIIGDVDVAHVNGRVTIRDLHGSAEVALINGTIDCEIFLNRNGYIHLDVVNGEVLLDIPKSTSAQLHAGTANGTVEFRDLPLTNTSGNSRDRSGTMGDGRGQIELGVVNGNISVKGM